MSLLSNCSRPLSLLGVLGSTVLLAGAGSEPGSKAPPRAVIHWRMDEDSGTRLLDGSGHGSDGVLKHGPTRVDGGRFGRAVRFDGVNDYAVRNPFDGLPRTEISVVLWIRTSDRTGLGAPISYAVEGQSNELLMLAPAGLVIYLKGQNVETGVTINDGEWHHLALTWRSVDGALDLFKDGVNVFSDTLVPGRSLRPGGSFVLAREQDAVEGGFDPNQTLSGLMDDVRVYDGVLSPDEVRDLAEHAPDAIDELALWWPMDEGAGRILRDASESGHHATLDANVAWASGQYGGALRFDHRRAYAAVNPIAGFPGREFTVSYWARSTDERNLGATVSYAVPGQSNEFLVIDQRNVVIYVKGEALETGLSFNDGAWHHIAVSWDSYDGHLRYYQDGVLGFETFSRAARPLVDGGSLVLGQDQDAIETGFESQQAFRGDLDELRLYRRVLTTEEVRVLSGRDGPRCEPPPPPALGVPANGAVGVARSVDLSWGARSPLSRGKVIYGGDDRREIYQIEDQALFEAWESTAAILNRGALRDNHDGTFTALGPEFGDYWGLCAGEPFADQPSVANCSGFLVGPDIVATAGHCIDEGNCGDWVFVFGFRMLDRATVADTFDASDIYYCREIVARQLDPSGADWALVRLDREVGGRTPLRLRREGVIADGQSLVVIGHPSGLPAKIAGGARVRENREEAYFSANLDTYGGNSGSAVFNAATLEVEGILVRGEQDFVWQGDCYASLECSDDGCTGEDVTRATLFADLIPPEPEHGLTYEVQFGRCGSMTPVAETRVSRFTVSGLEPETRYCWRIVAHNDCGTTIGPVWSFTTAGRGNDDFADRVPLQGDAGTVLASNVDATAERNEPAHVGIGAFASIWWSWTPLRSGEAVFETTGSGFDTMLAVYSGLSLGGLQAVAANDDADGLLQSRVRFFAHAGTQYQIAVDGYSGATGHVRLRYSAFERSLQKDGNRNVFVRGDVNADGATDIEDAIRVLEYLLAGRGSIECLKSADVNDDGRLELVDALALLEHVFASHAASPAPPAGRCGADPTADALSCDVSACLAE